MIMQSVGTWAAEGRCPCVLGVGASAVTHPQAFARGHSFVTEVLCGAETILQLQELVRATLRTLHHAMGDS